MPVAPAATREPGRRHGRPSLILTRPSVDELHLEPRQLDLDRFEALVADARSRNDAQSAVAILREALVSGEGRRFGVCLRGVRSPRSSLARAASASGHRRAGRAWSSGWGATHDLVGELEALRFRNPHDEQTTSTTDAHALPVRSPGGGAGGSTEDPTSAGRGARDRARAVTSGARAGDPAPGSAPRSRALARRRAPATNRSGESGGAVFFRPRRQTYVRPSPSSSPTWSARLA